MYIQSDILVSLDTVADGDPADNTQSAVPKQYIEHCKVCSQYIYLSTEFVTQLGGNEHRHHNWTGCKSRIHGNSREITQEQPRSERPSTYIMGLLLEFSSYSFRWLLQCLQAAHHLTGLALLYMSVTYAQPYPMDGYGQPYPMDGYAQPYPMDGYVQPYPMDGYAQPYPMDG
ncbi:hypothetical protein J6590_059453 [Homalodisca vitripennis]|nr:hypothetical protein J6590_059453 [Homalodisca vitripennis]